MTLGQAKVEIRADMDHLRTGFGRAESLTRRMTGRMQAGLDRFAVAAKRAGMLAGAGLVAGLVFAAKAAAEQEAAEVNLASALAAHGDAVDRLLPKLKKAASAIQQQTTFGDEAIMNMMAQARNLGAAGDELDAYARAAIGLGKALNLDMTAALRYTTLALQGEFTILQRYVPALRQATTEAAKLAIVQGLMESGFAQAAAETQTAQGQLKQLRETIGDAAEVIGGALIPSVSSAAVAFKAWLDGDGGQRGVAALALNLQAVIFGLQEMPALLEIVQLKMAKFATPKWGLITFWRDAFDKVTKDFPSDVGDKVREAFGLDVTPAVLDAELKKRQDAVLNKWRDYQSRLQQQLDAFKNKMSGGAGMPGGALGGGAGGAAAKLPEWGDPGKAAAAIGRNLAAMEREEQELFALQAKLNDMMGRGMVEAMRAGGDEWGARGLEIEQGLKRQLAALAEIEMAMQVAYGGDLPAKQAAKLKEAAQTTIGAANKALAKLWADEEKAKKGDFTHRMAGLREMAGLARGGQVAAGKDPEEEVAENTKNTVTAVDKLATLLRDRTFEARFR